MDYNKTVLKRWSRTILSICSTLLNVPLKLKGRSRIRLGFGFFFCVFTIIFQCRCPHNAAVRRHRRKTAGLPVLSSGRCFPPGGASCCFHGPFTGRVIYLFCFSPRQLRQALSLLLQPFLSPAFLPCCKIGHTEARQKRWIFQRKIQLIFLFLFY